MPEGTGEPDVRIVTGGVSARLPGAVRTGVRFQVAPGELWLQVDGVARYLARAGGEVVVDRSAGAPDDSVRLFLLGSVFAGLLHQRGVLPLNASAIATERGAAVFMGLSGAGKSTLALGFQRRGYRVLTDDLCAITFRDGEPVVWPGEPRLRLWPNLLSELGVDPEPLCRVRPELEKRALPLGEAFAADPLAAVRLYVLGPVDHRVELTPVAGPGRLGTLGIHTYGSQFVEGLGREAAYFDNLAGLAGALPIQAIARPDSLSALDGLIDRLEEDLGS